MGNLFGAGERYFMKKNIAVLVVFSSLLLPLFSMKEVFEHDKNWKEEKKLFLEKVQKWDKKLKDCFETDNQPYVNNVITKKWVAHLVENLVSVVVSDTRDIFASLSPSSKKAMVTDLCFHASSLYCVLINTGSLIKNLEESSLPVLMTGVTDLLLALYYPIIHPVIEFFLTYYSVNDNTLYLCAPIIFQRRTLFLSLNKKKKIYFDCKKDFALGDCVSADWRNMLFKGDFEHCFIFFKKLTEALNEGELSLALFWGNLDNYFEFSCMQERYKKEIGLIFQSWLCTFLEKNPTLYTRDFKQKSTWEKWYKDLDVSLATFFEGEVDVVFQEEEITGELF